MLIPVHPVAYPSPKSPRQIGTPIRLRRQLSDLLSMAKNIPSKGTKTRLTLTFPIRYVHSWELISYRREVLFSWLGVIQLHRQGSGPGGFTADDIVPFNSRSHSQSGFTFFHTPLNPQHFSVHGHVDVGAMGDLGW